MSTLLDVSKVLLYQLFSIASAQFGGGISMPLSIVYVNYIECNNFLPFIHFVCDCFPTVWQYIHVLCTRHSSTHVCLFVCEREKYAN